MSLANIALASNFDQYNLYYQTHHSWQRMHNPLFYEDLYTLFSNFVDPPFLSAV